MADKREFQDGRGREIELTMEEFTSLVTRNREAVLRILGVRKGPPRLRLDVEETEDGEIRSRVSTQTDDPTTGDF